MPSYTNRFHDCRAQALDLIHELLVLDARCQDDAASGDEGLHAAAVVAQYQLDYALERARAATVVPTRSCGPATPRDHIESRDACERFLQNGQTIATRQQLSPEHCLVMMLGLAELALGHARHALSLARQAYESEGRAGRLEILN